VRASNFMGEGVKIPPYFIQKKVGVNVILKARHKGPRFHGLRVHAP
jgi:hypothetical protein